MAADKLESVLKVIKISLENGALDVNDPNILAYIESLCGQKIKPWNDSDPTKMNPEYLKTILQRGQMLQQNNRQANSQRPQPGTTGTVNGQQMKVVKTELPAWMDKNYGYSEMYRVAVDETKKKMDESVVLGKKNFSIDAKLAWEKWCTPELFTYLSKKGPRAEADLRAAVWPAKVSFQHRIMKSDEKSWIIPYITFFIDGTNNTDIVKKGQITLSFYLNKNEEVHAIPGRVEQIFEDSNFKDETALKTGAFKYWQKSDAELNLNFVNPDTGKIQRAIVKFDGTEGYCEKIRGGNSKWGEGNNYRWCQWRDVTNFFKNGRVDYDSYWALRDDPEIDRKGREAIANLQRELYRTDNQEHYSGSRDYDTETRTDIYTPWEYYSRDGRFNEWEQL